MILKGNEDLNQKLSELEEALNGLKVYGHRGLGEFYLGGNLRYEVF